jgi:hypothetical protein
MIKTNDIDESIKLLRELQIMLFDEKINNQILFSKTVEIDNILNTASINYNKYLNNIEKK